MPLFRPRPKMAGLIRLPDGQVRPAVSNALRFWKLGLINKKSPEFTSGPFYIYYTLNVIAAPILFRKKRNNNGSRKKVRLTLF